MNSQIFTTLNADELAALVAEKVLAILSQQQSKTASNPDAKPGYVSRKEVAKLFHINLKTVNEWTKTGRLKGYRIGRRVLYKQSELDATLKAINTK